MIWSCHCQGDGTISVMEDHEHCFACGKENPFRPGLMPRGASTGNRSYQTQRGKQRDWARAQAQGGTITRVRDPEVKLMIKAIYHEPTGKHTYQLDHSSNHPGSQTLRLGAEDFGILLEHIQDVLEGYLEEEL